MTTWLKREEREKGAVLEFNLFVHLCYTLYRKEGGNKKTKNLDSHAV